MTLLALIARLAFRNRLRSTLTALGVGFTLLAFLMLRTLVSSWYSVNEEIAHSDRMVVRHKISIRFKVFVRQAQKIRTLPGVEEASYMIWFSGNYKDEGNAFGQLAVSADSYFRIYPEYRAPPVEMQQFMADRAGAIAGDELAQKYGWKLGDTITVHGTLFPGDWDYTLRGIYHGDGSDLDRGRFYTHYERLDPTDQHAHRLLVKGEPGVAKDIDALFANSDMPTKTESEISEQRAWASWSKAVVTAINIGSLLILAILVLVLGNSMAMATRESTREFAAMRAIGYRSRHITGLVLAQGCLVATLGIALGLGVAPAALDLFSKLLEDGLGGAWPLALDPVVTGLAALVALVTGMLATAWPAWFSGHLRLVDALRGVV